MDELTLKKPPQGEDTPDTAMASTDALALKEPPTRRYGVRARLGRLVWLLRRGLIPLAVAAVPFFGLGMYWSIEPAVFHVRDAVPRHLGRVPDKPVTGVVTTATLIEVASTLLEKRGGFLSNDINPLSLWLDNLPNWEYGALVQVRDLSRVLRNDFSRSQTQSSEDRDLVLADPHLHFDHVSWIFPTTEGEYRTAIDSLKRYLFRLERGDAQFFTRFDNLRFYMELVAQRLGDLGHRLSGSVGIEDIEAFMIWDVKDLKMLPAEARRADYRTPWLQIDDVFYEARGASWALLHFLYAIQIDFAEILNERRAMVSLTQTIRKLDQTQGPVWSPVILNGTGFGMVNNHSLVLASFISRAAASVLDLLDLLRK